MCIIFSVCNGQALLKSPCPVSPCHASAISMSGVPNPSSLTLFLKYWVGNLMFLLVVYQPLRLMLTLQNGGFSNGWASGCLWWTIFSDWDTVQLVMWHSYSDFTYHHYRWWAYFHVEYEKRHLTFWSMVWGRMF